MNIINTPSYQKAFIQYLRKGTPIGLSIKAALENEESSYRT